MKARLIARVYVDCPACDRGEFRIDHMFGSIPRDCGPWRCPACRSSVVFRIRARDDVDVEVLAREPADRHKLVVLAVDPKLGPIYLTVEGWTHGGDVDGDPYYYEEGTCPTNWVRDIAMLVHDGDFDPHGLVRHVATVIVPDTFPFEDDGMQPIVAAEIAVDPGPQQ